MNASEPFALPAPHDWRVFHGDANPTEARVYVQVRVPGAPSRLRLTGTIEGPTSRYARTLPTVTRITGGVAGDGILAEAILPEPCFWSPELPYLYRARIALELNGQTLWQGERRFGLRRLGRRGSKLSFDAKNWVLRGAWVVESDDFDWDAWREHDLAAVIENPSESFCAAADERGLFVVAVCGSSGEVLLTQLCNYQRHPSVGIVVCDAAAGLQRSAIPPNLLWGAFRGSNASLPVWADLCWQIASGSNPFLDNELPRILVRRTGGSAADRRAACDLLQRDFALLGDFAGYVS